MEATVIFVEKDGSVCRTVVQADCDVYPPLEVGGTVWVGPADDDVARITNIHVESDPAGYERENLS